LLLMHHGVMLDLVPNEVAHTEFPEYNIAISGVAGHDACIQPPPGVDLFIDPNCESKFSTADVQYEDVPIHYPHDHCTWTDTDCDNCTGILGLDTARRWLEPGDVLPGPHTRTTPGDRQITVDWDNYPEVLLASHQAGGAKGKFIGYRLYKLANWRNRES